MRVLLVEDDALLGQAVQLGLSDRDFSVHWVRTGGAAISELNHNEYDAMILDLGLPDLDGSRVLSSIRKRGGIIPILVLTAREHVHDKIAHLDAGADDYLTKPFDMNELAARLRALCRRRIGQASSDMQVGPLQLNVNTREVSVAGESISLSRREFELLKAMMSAPERVLSRDRLEQAVFQSETDIESNALEVHVSNLRRKLGHKEWIETIRGIGYRLKCN